ncbi:MAG: hypothetical protein M3R51_03270 [Candidatus Eremiobacteraeota bacterium]|nr:hypothetical protein [Candidatus Eremiobacteraeota bacterium]
MLYGFPPGTGTKPNGAPVFDAQGNIFGSTYEGGGKTRDGYAAGTVYELKTSQSGYVHSDIHRFTRESVFGNLPGPIRMDAAGNIWGIASKGVFEIPPTHVAQLIYPCHGGSGNKASNPVTGVTIIGTTIYGVCGAVVFKLTGLGTSYTETTLYTFPESPAYYPNGDLAIDSRGDVYGTTFSGPLITGEVYKLTPSASTYSYSVLHTFAGPNDGLYPHGGVYIDPTGALIGTTQYDRANNGNGLVYALRPDGSGGYTETIIDQSPAINEPDGTPVEDSAGAIYIATQFGNTYGNVVKLVPNGSGYTEDVLYTFPGPAQANPDGTVSLDSSGAVYGSADQYPQGGIIYKISQ